MATNKASYGPLTAATITISALASGSARESAVIDNSGTCFMDLLIALDAVLAAGTLNGSPVLNVFLVPSPDGLIWPSPATGVDSAITFTDANAAYKFLVGVIPVAAAGGALKHVLRTCLAFDNAFVLPPYFSIVIENGSGVDLTSCAVSYMGLQIETA